MKPRTVQSPLLQARIEQPDGQSTVRVDLWTAKTGAALGLIAWEPKWSQYAFTPAQGARYTVKVLRAISRQLDICMRTWERQNDKAVEAQEVEPTTSITSRILPVSSN